MTLTQLFTNIANAIRSKKGTSGTIIAENFPSEINSIVTPNLQSKSLNVTQNGTQTVTPDSGYNGLDEVEIITDVQGGTSEYNAKINAVFTETNNTLIKNIVSIPDNLDTSSITNLQHMLSGCSSLKSIPLLNTSNATRMDSMFRDCTNLESIPLLNTSSCTSMSYMFQNCTNLKTIPLLDTSSVTNMNSMFNRCSSLKTIPLLDTSSVTNMNGMFNGCSSLETIPQLDTSSVTSLQSMFSNCSSLTDESLNNILAMCINATSYTGTKKIIQLGFNRNTYPASRIQALSNYQSFLDAGWTIGY